MNLMVLILRLLFLAINPATINRTKYIPRTQAMRVAHRTVIYGRLNKLSGAMGRIGSIYYRGFSEKLTFAATIYKLKTNTH